MSLNAATIEFLLGKGLSGEDLLVVARKIEAERPRSSAAKRQARYRQRQAERDECNVTGDVTPAPKENIKPPSSEANASGGSPPADPIKQVFDLGVSILTSTGTPERQSRSLIGKWCKAKGEAQVLQALLEAKSKANPIEWIEARFRTAKWTSKSGHEYRGTDEQVMREAERRGDNDTYWAVKSALKQRQAA